MESIIPAALMSGAAAAGAAAVALGAHVAPQALRRGSVARMRELCRRKRMICLTFDDGPGADLTPRVLEALKRHGTRATFFALGMRALARPDLLDLVEQAGHEIGVHSARHLNGWKTSPWRAAADVRDGYETLARWAPPSARFRPPFGKLSIGQYWELRKRGSSIDWWTFDSRDTKPALPDPDVVWEAILRDDGGVILLHDMDRQAEHAQRAEFVLRVTELVIERARSAGMRLGALSDLFEEAS